VSAARAPYSFFTPDMQATLTGCATAGDKQTGGPRAAVRG